MTKFAENGRQAIEEEITTGKPTPGARLDEAHLVPRFGVSRTPVREALHLLAGEVLVATRPERGMDATEVPLDRVVEMIEVLANLEAICARQAARRITAEERQALVRS